MGNWKKTAAALLLLAMLSGCTTTSPSSVEDGTAVGGTPSQQQAGQESSSQSQAPESAVSVAPEQQEVPSDSSASQTSGEIDQDKALSIAMENASVPEDDAYNIKVERDGDNSIPIYDIEFETDYGDYDFEVAIDDGRIVGADYEINEEWLSRLGGSQVSQEDAKVIAASKIPGSSREDIRIQEEGDDGRTRYEGWCQFDNMEYEFEMDPETGIIFDWNADLQD
ncbi:MAG TPA: PepSY domain-containing protein [Firmicutes bacterium]|nr:PepSY domain-containing protein [Bacillota bacterium]